LDLKVLKEFRVPQDLEDPKVFRDHKDLDLKVLKDNKVLLDHKVLKEFWVM
jgi:hypothetical protein